MICNQYDVVVVPFPFTDRPTSKRRPALALSALRFNSESGHTLLAMITSADNPPWPLDVPIDSTVAGLRVASKVRLKLFTLDNRIIAQKAGSLRERDKKAVAKAISELLSH